MLQNAKLELFLTTVAVLIIMLKYLLVVEKNCALNLHYQNPLKNLIFQTWWNSKIKTTVKMFRVARLFHFVLPITTNS